MKIEVLFSEVCNLYGDLANVRYLKACRPELEIVETDLHTKPRFLDEDVALVFMGSTTEQGLKLATEALLPWREAIAAKIDGGQRFLAVGNAVDMLTEGIRSDGGLAVTGLGLVPGQAEYRMMQRHNSFFLGTFEDMEIVGFKSLFGHIQGAGDAEAWFRAVRGVGRDGATAAEGFRRGGLMATSLIGPLLILNPPLTKWLLRDMGLDDTLAFEDAAMDSYRKRVAEFHEESRGWKY